jgi:hypothetical protein
VDHAIPAALQQGVEDDAELAEVAVGSGKACLVDEELVDGGGEASGIEWGVKRVKRVSRVKGSGRERGRSSLQRGFLCH